MLPAQLEFILSLNDCIPAMVYAFYWEISPSLTQVHRTVIQLKRKQDMFMDGVKVILKILPFGNR
jgi:hypothetical protein